jgi:hypothetical protein
MPESTDTTKPSNKPKVRLLIKISLALSIIILILMLAEAVTFYIYIESGGLNAKWGDISTALFPSCYLIPFICLFAVICIISTLNKPRDANFTIAVVSLVIALIAGFSPNFTSYPEPLRYWAHNQMDLKTLKWISEELPNYARNHEGKLPSTVDWYKSLIDSAEVSTDPNAPKSYLRPERQTRYALNNGVADMPLSEIAPNTVLIFETKYIFETHHDKDLVGGPENITATYHYGKGCVVMFGDLHIEFIRAEDFNDLRWNP